MILRHVTSKIRLSFCVITFEPIKIQTHSAPQNDRPNLSFVKDAHVEGGNLAWNSCKTATCQSTFFLDTLYNENLSSKNVFRGISCPNLLVLLIPFPRGISDSGLALFNIMQYFENMLQASRNMLIVLLWRKLSRYTEFYVKTFN
jgi:hypothetical protein